MKTTANPRQRSQGTRTIRGRALGSLLLTGLVLAPLLLAIVWVGATQLEDRLLRRQLELEVQRLAEAWHRDGERPSGSEPFTAFWPGDTVPPAFARQRAEGMPWAQRPSATQVVDGLYESDANDSFFRALPLEDGTLLVFLDAAGQEPLEDNELRFLMAVGGALIGAFALAAIVLAYRLDRDLVEPVRLLADATENWQLHDWREGDPPGAERDDELGVLARSTRASALRINGFLEREREFTRNASHELRSPLTVVRGALELLEHQVGNESAAQAPLARIERATQRMESTIETFLWLAREESPTPETAVQVRPILDECLEQLLAASPRRDQFEVHLHAPTDLTLQAHPQILRVMCDNLIGNALRHGAPGKVTISWDRRSFEVRNRTLQPVGAEPPAIEIPPQGPGFGLRIVHQLCARSGWALQVAVEEDAAVVGSSNEEMLVRARVSFDEWQGQEEAAVPDPSST